MKYAAILVVVCLGAGSVPAQAQKVEPATIAGSATLAEMPLWPIGLRLSAEQNKRGADVLIWTPPGVKRIRAMMLVPNNSDSKILIEHDALRKVAAKHEVGIVYMRNYNTGIEYAHSKPVETPPVAPDAMLKLLEVVAKETGIPEFRHAPWITLGKSSRGEFPFRMGWLYPERTIAGITYHVRDRLGRFLRGPPSKTRASFTFAPTARRSGTAHGTGMSARFS